MSQPEPVRFTEPMPLVEAVAIMVRTANRDPAEVTGVFDASDAIITPAGTVLPPKGQRFVVIFQDRTFLQIDWDLRANREYEQLLKRVGKDKSPRTSRAGGKADR